MASSQPSSSTSGGKPDRLFVGNLAPNVDEYTLVQVFSKYGKITKLDVMYHKTGPLKGKPRGYAFIEFSSKDDALKALVKLHDRLLRGRKLVVTYANSAPPDDYTNPKARRVDAAKPTTLSLLKSKSRPQSAEAQIAAMEAKLAAMSKRANRTPTPERAERAAAEALEAEIMKELAEEGGIKDGSRAGTPSATEGQLASISKEASPAPPKETSRSASPPTKRPRKDDDPTRIRREEFERGLASLPAKPAFSA